MSKHSVNVGGARPHERGFTVLELMIALLLSAFVVIATYGFFTTASDNTRRQDDAVRSLERLDFGLAMLRADLEMAAYLGVPNASLPSDQQAEDFRLCHDPATDGAVSWPIGDPIGAIRVNRQVIAGFADISPMGANGVAELELFGAYQIPEVLRVTGALGNTITLTMPTQVAMIPDTVGQRQRAEFQRLIDGGTLAVMNRFGGAVMADLQPPNPASPTVGEVVITAMPQLLASEGEACRFGLGVEIFEPGQRAVVLHRVRYRLEEAGDPDTRTNADWQLVRSVLRPGAAGADPVEVERTILARNIVDFQVFFDLDLSAPALPPNILRRPAGLGDGEILGGTIPADDATGRVNRCPHRLRHAYVQLSARFDQALPGLRARPDLALRDTVTVDGEVIPVVTMRAEIPLRNFYFADQTGAPCI